MLGEIFDIVRIAALNSSWRWQFVTTHLNTCDQELQMEYQNSIENECSFFDFAKFQLNAEISSCVSFEFLYEKRIKAY